MAEWITDKSVDFCFAAKPGTEIGYHWIPICMDELTVLLPADDDRAQLEKFPIKELNGTPFIITMPDEDTDIDDATETAGRGVGGYSRYYYL